MLIWDFLWTHSNPTAGLGFKPLITCMHGSRYSACRVLVLPYQAFPTSFNSIAEKVELCQRAKCQKRRAKPSTTASAGTRRPARSSSSHHIPTTALRLPGQRPLPPELLRRFRFRCRACIRWERRAARRHLRVLRRGVTRFGRSVCARCGTGRGRLRGCCWSSDTTAGH